MSKLMFFALGFSIAVLLSYFGGWPISRHDIYDEIKEWAPAVVILIAAWFGLKGINVTLAANASLARKQVDAEIERETCRRRNLSKDLAHSIAAELRACVVNMRAAAGVIENRAKQKKPIDLHTWRAIHPPPIALYLTQMPNIGLLGELAGKTVDTYNQIQISIRHDEMLLRDFENGGLPMDPSTFEIDDRWKNRADQALDLLQRLNKYEPRAD